MKQVIATFQVMEQKLLIFFVFDDVHLNKWNLLALD